VAENPPLVAGDVRKKKVVRFALPLKEGYEYAAKEGESFEDISSKYGGAKSRTRSGGRNGAVITPIIDDYEEEEPTSVVGLDRKSTKIDLAGRPFPIIPTSYSEAMTTPYANEWRAECQNEFKVSDFKMPSTLSLPLQEPLSSTRSGLSAKTNEEHNLVRVKGRLCAKGLKRLPYFEQFGPRSAALAPWPTVLVFLGFIAIGRLFVKVTDMVKGYVAAPMGLITDKPVFMKQPDGFVDPEHPTWVLRIKRALYGLPNSGRALHLLLRNQFEEEGFQAVADDITIYSGVKEGERVDYLSYVDDGIVAGTGPRRQRSSSSGTCVTNSTSSFAATSTDQSFSAARSRTTQLPVPSSSVARPDRQGHQDPQPRARQEQTGSHPYPEGGGVPQIRRPR
jgi:hypothetical protein